MKDKFFIFSALQVLAFLVFYHIAHSQSDNLDKFQSVNSATSQVGQRSFKSVPRGNATDDLRLETIDNVLESRARRQKFDSLVRRSLYFKYLSDAVDLREEYNYVLDEENMAEKLVFYETARMLGEQMKDSSLFDMYKNLLENLKSLNDKATLTLEKDGAGKYDLNSGVDKENAFLKFKMHFSAQRGVEPRMHFSENLALRYDVFNQETFLEYRCGF